MHIAPRAWPPDECFEVLLSSRPMPLMVHSHLQRLKLPICSASTCLPVYLLSWLAAGCNGRGHAGLARKAAGNRESQVSAGIMLQRTPSSCCHGRHNC